MTTAAARTRPGLDRWTVAIVVGIVDAVAGFAGVLATSGALLVASWILLIAGVDLALFAWWRSRRQPRAAAA